jgi:23S rRNA U2552 (ribose-2'-O)-methylase RlmE/FtsJ
VRALAAAAAAAVALAERVLVPHGNLLLKVFQSADVEPTLDRVQSRFRTVRLTHTEATQRLGRALRRRARLRRVNA